MPPPVIDIERMSRERGGPLLLDGALATELEKRGHDIGGKLWSARILLERPEAIEALHEEYFHAGADCVITASYQATVPGLRELGMNDAAARGVLLRSVELACRARERYEQSRVAADAPSKRLVAADAQPKRLVAADAQPKRLVAADTQPKRLVAASIGPYGAYLHDGSEYRGDYGLNEDELVAFHQSRFELLATSGADLLACETLPSLVEARALARLLRAAPTTSAWIAFSCKDGAHTCGGDDIGECAAALDDVDNLVAVGVNCTPPQYVAPLIEAIRARSAKPVVVYPNSGESWNATLGRWEGCAADADIIELAPRWFESGALMIGGCCRTGPADIARLAKRFFGV